MITSVCCSDSEVLALHILLCCCLNNGNSWLTCSLLMSPLVTQWNVGTRWLDQQPNSTVIWLFRPTGTQTVSLLTSFLYLTLLFFYFTFISIHQPVYSCICHVSLRPQSSLSLSQRISEARHRSTCQTPWETSVVSCAAQVCIKLPIYEYNRQEEELKQFTETCSVSF